MILSFVRSLKLIDEASALSHPRLISGAGNTARERRLFLQKLFLSMECVDKIVSG